MPNTLRHAPPSIPLAGLILLSLFSGLCVAAEPKELALVPYHLVYDATIKGMDINAERHLTREGDSYRLVSKADTLLASITEKGSFQMDPTGKLLGQQYTYERNIFGIRKDESLTYDRAAEVANYQSKKKQRQIKLDGDYFNKLTYQIQLQRDLINGSTPLHYQVIDRGKIKLYNFEIMGEEIVDTALGPINAVKVHRIRKGSDRETYMWFAPQMNYLLVQIWQNEDGDDHRITLKEGTLDNKPITAGNH
ncbi:DUF3108 domain-containing protein [Porticoccus sp.]|uniref:DUF3108 domain-containing protein n=1 Tax=Porticoccus sp. TaxID=2024853 RepID=UPI003F69BB78